MSNRRSTSTSSTTKRKQQQVQQQQQDKTPIVTATAAEAVAAAPDLDELLQCLPLHPLQRLVAAHEQPRVSAAFRILQGIQLLLQQQQQRQWRATEMNGS